MAGPTWITPAGSIGIWQEEIAGTFTFQATAGTVGNTIEFEFLGGTLPTTDRGAPLTFTTLGVLSGTPAQVAESVLYTFTIRANEYTGLVLADYSDRTFTLTVNGTSTPVWITGTNLGNVQDSVYFYTELQYSNPDPGTTAVITLVNGEIPPGLELSSTGVIGGYPLPPTEIIDLVVTPVNKIFNFTLELQSESGTALRDFTISVANQDVLGSNRAPVLYNTEPPLLEIPPTDPDAPFYTATNVIGTVKQGTKFAFKFVGHAFDQSADYDPPITPLPFIYIAENLPTLTPVDIANGKSPLTIDSETGWITGSVPTIGNTVETFVFTVYVRNVEVVSKRYRFALTVIGDINPEITWITDSDLGTIDNTTVCTKIVKAAAAQPGLSLAYRIVGNQTQADLNAITGTGTELLSVGQAGAYVVADLPGTDEASWQELLPLTNANLNDIIYGFTTPLAANYVRIAVGNRYNQSIILFSYDGISWAAQNPNNSNPLNAIIQYSNGRYLAVGDNGTILTSADFSLNVWVTRTVPVPVKLNAATVKPGGSPVYIVVGNNGYIYRSTNLSTWTRVGETVIASNLNDVIWDSTNSRFVIVGDSGVIIYSNSDGTTWTLANRPTVQNLTHVQTVALTSPLTPTIVAVGAEGAIVKSTNATYWTPVVQTITNNDFTGGYYDGDNLFLVGTGGTVLYSEDLLTWNTPTLGQLPETLNLLYTGDISGRVDFSATPGEYSFKVQVYNASIPAIKSSRDFTIFVNQEYTTQYSNLYIRALPNVSDRAKLNQLLTDLTIIPYESLYRFYDPYFGKAQYVRYDHLYGVRSVMVNDYINSIQLNHYWRNITLGELKTAIARDENNEIIYEVVYSEIIDNLVNNSGVSIPKQIQWPRYIPQAFQQWITSVLDIKDTDTYYDPSPISAAVTAISSDRTQITVSNIQNVIEGMNLTGVGVTNNTTVLTVSNIDSTTNQLTVPSTALLNPGVQVTFNQSNGNIVAGVIYYVREIIDSTHITLTLQRGSTVFPVSTSVPVGMTGTAVLTPPKITDISIAGRSLQYPSGGTITLDVAQPTLTTGTQVFMQYPAFTAATGVDESTTALYPNSLQNMREQVVSQLGNLNDSNLLPLWMTSQQRDGMILNFTPAWVICYTKPGLAETIKNNINTMWPYKLNQINFGVDRFEVDRSICSSPTTTTDIYDAYILFTQKNILPNSTQ